MSAPERVLLVPDDYHLANCGQAADGRFVLIASQMIWDGASTTDFVCTFRFDTDGRLVAHRIDRIGVRGRDGENDFAATIADHIQSAGPLDAVEFSVRPFSVTEHGAPFGLIAEQHDETGEWTVTFQPGNTMAFFEPWDSGDYDT
jgi:hypothetical protein